MDIPSIAGMLLVLLIVFEETLLNRMLINFFLHLREFRIPVSVREFLDLNSVLKSGQVFADREAFYYLSRLSLVKDEKYFDRFDRAFASYFSRADQPEPLFEKELIEESLRETLEAQLQSNSHDSRSLFMNQLDTILEDYREEVEEIRKAAQSKGLSGNQEETDSGTSESAEGDGEGEEGEEGEKGEKGNNGEGEEGEEGEEGRKGKGRNGEEGQGEGAEPGQGIKEGESPQQFSASKVWHERLFEDLDEEVELGTRNLKVALRRLRKFARTSLEEELDLEDTIRKTARNAGLLDIRMVPEKRNTIKVLLFLDVGGSMDPHIETCARLFSAAKTEFKHLEFFYFHNFVYESVWKNNLRRQEDRTSLLDITRTYGSDYKVIFVGDAHMGRYEITDRGGNVEYYNAQPGADWMRQLREHFQKTVWINPTPPGRWLDSDTIPLIQRLMEGEMYHLSVDGLSQAMRYLAR